VSWSTTWRPPPVSPGAHRGRGTSALARILASCGGWPYATAKPTARERRAFALRLLGDAFGQVLGPAPQQAPGITLERRATACAPSRLSLRVEVNLADAAALQTVEGLSVDSPRRSSRNVCAADRLPA
jgi:hypothetical protein